MSEASNDNAPREQRYRGVAHFIAARWRGEVPLERVFWSDMLLVGTLVNAAIGVLTLFLLANDAPTAFSIAVFFAPLPYNFLLFMGVWTAAARTAQPWSALARCGATLWLMVAFLL